MAEVAAISIAATIIAAALNIGSGFTRRHDESHQREIVETRRVVEDFTQNPQSGGVPPEEKVRFMETKTQADRRGNEYREKIESYKSTSWFNLPKKLKRKEDVRRAKRATMQSNNSLRTQLNEMRSAADLVEPFPEAGEVEDEATRAWRR